MDDMRVGAAFRAVRVQRRWRQSDVAERAGVSRSVVSAVERGHLGVTSLDTVRRIARASDIRVDVNDLVGNLDRKARLAPQIAADRGWRASTVSCWVIVSRDKTNQRRIAEHRAMLGAAFPQDGHTIRRWLSQPAGAVAALSMWTNARGSNASPTGSHRVRVPAASTLRP